jgi:hypothetical protein
VAASLHVLVLQPLAGQILTRPEPAVAAVPKKGAKP